MTNVKFRTWNGMNLNVIQIWKTIILKYEFFWEPSSLKLTEIARIRDQLTCTQWHPCLIYWKTNLGLIILHISLKILWFEQEKLQWNLKNLMISFELSLLSRWIDSGITTVSSMTSLESCIILQIYLIIHVTQLVLIISTTEKFIWELAETLKLVN